MNEDIIYKQTLEQLDRIINILDLKISKIESDLKDFKSNTMSKNSNSSNGPVFYSLRNNDEKKSQHELNKQNESLGLDLAANLIIEHYRRQPPKRL